MANGSLKGPLTSETIDNILVKDEITSVYECINSINAWAIPHWDWVLISMIGSVKVSKKTAEYLIGKIVKILPPEDKQKILLTWLNYGWSIDSSLEDWMIIVNFDKIQYKKYKIEEHPPTEYMIDK